MNPRLTVALTLACLAVLGAVVVAARERAADEPATLSTRYEGAVMPKGVRAPDFSLRTEEGRRVAMRSFRGRPVLVTFLYTTCEETCPGMAQTAKGALDQLGHDVPALAISVDPPRDTAQRARAFLEEQRARHRIDFVLGSRSELRPIWRGFAVQPQSIRQEHQARFTLVDKRGFQRIGFPGSQATPERLAHDLRLLERE